MRVVEIFLMARKKIIIICGPTAAGKTSAGLEICRRFNGEIVSADSQQVYRGMDIGTAKDDISGQGTRCHVIDVVDPDERFDASKYEGLADAAICDILRRGKLPIVVGGTGFYIKVLLEGLCEAPGRDERIRSELMKLREDDGAGSLYEILKTEDPEAALRLHPNDYSRIIRAIEVVRLTGRSISGFQMGQKRGKKYDALKIALNMDRSELYERINVRVDRMIEKGLIDEVKSTAGKYGFGIQSLKAVGYREIAAYLRQEAGLEDSINLTKQNTRHFAKRQITWFKADRENHWHSPAQTADIASKINSFLR